VAVLGWIVVGSILVWTIHFIWCDECCQKIYGWCLLECNIAVIPLRAMVNFSTPFVAMLLFCFVLFIILDVACVWMLFVILLVANVHVMKNVPRKHVERSPFGKVRISTGSVKIRIFWELCNCENGL